MTPRDRQAFKQLPATMVAYRGCIAGLNEDGLSWTLSKPKAQWFAKRIGEDDPTVKQRVVSKSEVFAYLNTRKERELVILS